MQIDQISRCPPPHVRNERVYSRHLIESKNTLYLICNKYRSNSTAPYRHDCSLFHLYPPRFDPPNIHSTDTPQQTHTRQTPTFKPPHHAPEYALSSQSRSHSPLPRHSTAPPPLPPPSPHTCSPPSSPTHKCRTDLADSGYRGRHNTGCCRRCW